MYRDGVTVNQVISGVVCMITVIPVPKDSIAQELESKVDTTKLSVVAFVLGFTKSPNIISKAVPVLVYAAVANASIIEIVSGLVDVTTH